MTSNEKFEAWFAPHFDRVNEACTPSSVSSMRELLRAAYRVGHRDGLDEALQKVVESLAKAETEIVRRDQ